MRYHSKNTYSSALISPLMSARILLSAVHSFVIFLNKCHACVQSHKRHNASRTLIKGLCEKAFACIGRKADEHVLQVTRGHRTHEKQDAHAYCAPGTKSSYVIEYCGLWFCCDSNTPPVGFTRQTRQSCTSFDYALSTSG